MFAVEDEVDRAKNGRLDIHGCHRTHVTMGRPYERASLMGFLGFIISEQKTSRP